MGGRRVGLAAPTRSYWIQRHPVGPGDRRQTPFWYHKQFFAEAGRFLGNPFLKIAAFLKPEFPKGPRCQRRDRICFGVNLELRSYTPPWGPARQCADPLTVQFWKKSCGDPYTANFFQNPAGPANKQPYAAVIAGTAAAQPPSIAAGSIGSRSRSKQRS